MDLWLTAGIRSGGYGERRYSNNRVEELLGMVFSHLLFVHG